MNIELSSIERDQLVKMISSYLSELRHTIAATKRGTAPLHAEETLIESLQRKLSLV